MNTPADTQNPNSENTNETNAPAPAVENTDTATAPPETTPSPAEENTGETLGKELPGSASGEDGTGAPETAPNEIAPAVEAPSTPSEPAPTPEPDPAAPPETTPEPTPAPAETTKEAKTPFLKAEDTCVHNVLRTVLGEMKKLAHFTEEEFIKLGNLVKMKLEDSKL